MLHGGMAGLLLAENSESAANGCTYADQVLQAADGQAVDATEREAIANDVGGDRVCGGRSCGGSCDGGGDCCEVDRRMVGLVKLCWPMPRRRGQG